MDYSHFINPQAARRRAAITRELTKRHHAAPKEAISLAEGMPSEATFPFVGITLTLKDGSQLEMGEPELSAALQYNATQGYPPLLETLRAFTHLVHRPPRWADGRTDVLVTVGSQDGISRAIEMCLEDGDPILVQEPLYPGAEAVLRPLKAVVLPVEQDGEGMVPEALERALAEWKGRRPKMVYVNPTAANPTGTTIPLRRRRQIYAICSAHNLLILEDDPYHFLHFDDDAATPSFLALDGEGRVLRVDSLSKILCPGLRLGWLTGPSELVRRVELHAQASYLHASSLCQLLAHRLFAACGFDGFLARLHTVRAYYRARRDVALRAMDAHLHGLAEWTPPTGGMFVWLRVRGVRDVRDMLMTRAPRRHVTFVPGHAFMADPAAACPFVRASFSKASPAQIDAAMRALAALIVEEQQQPPSDGARDARAPPIDTRRQRPLVATPPRAAASRQVAHLAASLLTHEARIAQSGNAPGECGRH